MKVFMEMLSIGIQITNVSIIGHQCRYIIGFRPPGLGARGFFVLSEKEFKDQHKRKLISARQSGGGGAVRIHPLYGNTER
jgi:hypothetical protein